MGVIDLNQEQIESILQALMGRRVAGDYWVLGRGDAIDISKISNVTHLCALCFKAGGQDKQKEIRDALGVKDPR